MARMARVVIPNYPHHVTQRGNRKQRTFFSERDYSHYRSLLAAAKEKAGIDIWAYCLMPNHVHLVAIPTRADGLAILFREAHLRYTRSINDREGWRGHLWQERYHSFPMDEQHLWIAVRYIELNPVRAGLCAQPQDWRWSSIHAHLGAHDELANPEPMLRRVGDWRRFLNVDVGDSAQESLRRHSRTGRPAGDDEFVTRLELVTGRRLRPLKSGPRKGKND